MVLIPFVLVELFSLFTILLWNVLIWLRENLSFFRIIMKANTLSEFSFKTPELGTHVQRASIQDSDEQSNKLSLQCFPTTYDIESKVNRYIISSLIPESLPVYPYIHISILIHPWLSIHSSNSFTTSHRHIILALCWVGVKLTLFGVNWKKKRKKKSYV